MFGATQSKENAIAATQLYLQILEAKVTRQTIEDTLKSHPDFPSLLATQDALHEWKIDNLCVRIRPEQFAELEFPFLTYLNLNGGFFAVVKSIKDDTVEWIHTQEGLKKEKTEDFLTKWNGVVLMAETNEESGERNYAEKRKKELISNLRLPFLIGGIILLLLSFGFSHLSSDWYYNTILLTRISGTLISSLLLWQSIDAHNPFIRTLCQLGNANDCYSILRSKASQLTSWLSWSEVGLLYFAGGLISLLINPLTASFFYFISMFAIMYSCWSVYYQAFVIKQWCNFCLAIQVILGIEFFVGILAFSNENYKFLSDLNAYNSIFQAFAIVLLIWVFLKPFFQKSQETQGLKTELRRFKLNTGLFHTLHQQQEQMPPVGSDVSPVLYGNHLAAHTITMVTNPFCQPCSQTHQILQTLIDDNDKLNCEIIFAVSQNKNEDRDKVALSIVSLPPDEQIKALHDWYSRADRNIEKWRKENMINENKKAESILEKHLDWCQSVPISQTPVVFLNGFKIPDLYSLEDLKGILKYLPTTDFAKS